MRAIRTAILVLSILILILLGISYSYTPSVIRTIITYSGGMDGGYWTNTVSGTSVAYVVFSPTRAGVPEIWSLALESDLVDANVVIRYGQKYARVTTNTIVATNWIPIGQESEEFGDGSVCLIVTTNGYRMWGLGMDHVDDYIVLSNTLPQPLTTNDTVWFLTAGVTVNRTNVATELRSPIARFDTIGSIEIYGSSTARVAAVIGAYVRP